MNRTNQIYLLKRIVTATVSLFIVSTAVFAITQILPGNAATVILGNEATEEAVKEIEAQLGLNRPLWQQYIDYMIGLLTLNFGISLTSQQPVMSMVWPRFIRTLQLAMVTMGMTVITAIPLGVIAAKERDSKIDYLITTSTYLGMSVPSFVTATLLLLVFTTGPFGFLPSGGYTPISQNVIEWLQRIFLPALSLTVIVMAYVLRQTRSSMIETLESKYIRTARLKGVGESKVLFNHALRNGLLPTVTVLAINFGWLMGAVVIVEEIFRYPGIGELIVIAIRNRDLPVIQAGVLIPSAAFIFANLTADIVYTWLDPRITMGDQ